MNKRQRLTWVDESFYYQLKKKAALDNKAMLQITREIAEELRNENEQKER